jgi:phage FluMu protein Com
MPIELNCITCGERLRVADSHAGKRARCPKCQGINEIPAANAEHAPQLPNMTPAVLTQTSTEKWQLKLEDGRTFGPVEKMELDRWLAEGRITPRSQVMSDRRKTWQWAGEVYAALGVPQTTQAMPQTLSSGMATGSLPQSGNGNPFGESAVNPYNPYSATGGAGNSYNYPRASWQKAHRGGLILAFGLLGMLVCFIFSPIALIMGHADLGEMKRGIMDREGHGLTLAGVVLGWVVVVPTLIGILIFMMALVAGIAAN